MSVSAAVFESASQRTEHYVPGVYSRSNNVSSPSGVSAGNHVIIGTSQGGKPCELLSFGSVAEAKDTLVSGDLLNAIAYAFNGSNTYIPQRVYALRVNKGTQSELKLSTGDTEILTMKSWDYGTHCNQLKLWLDDGTAENSKKLTVVYKSNTIEMDNIIKPSISLVYVGENTNPVVSVDSTGLTVSCDDNADKFTFAFEDVNTIEELVTSINDTALWVAEVLDSTSDSKVSDLDNISNKSCSDDVILYSNVKALIDALNSVDYVEDVKFTGSSRIIPENTNGYVYFTGGTNGTSSTSDWADALQILESENIQIISTPSTNANVHTMIADHCANMSSTVNRKERTCILGADVGVSDSDAIAAAKGFNSKYVSYIPDNAIASNPITGATETVSGAIIAVMCAAMESAMAVNEPLTFKTLKLLGFSKKRTISNMETMIKAGLMVCNPNPENTAEYVVIRALTTFQGNNDLISCERSMVREDLYMNRDLRNRFSTSVGKPSESSTDTIIQSLKLAAREWGVKNYIVPNGTDWVWNIKVRISGDKVYLTFSRYLTAPRNFIFITATNYIYESTVEV